MTEKEFISQIQASNPIINTVCHKYFSNESRTDLTQDIIAEAWKSINNWKNNCKFKTWIYTIARNVCVSKLRQQVQQPVIEYVDFYYEDDLIEVDATAELVKQMEDEKRYIDMLNCIQQPYRNIFHMYVHGANFKELENMYGMSANKLRVKVFRIKQQFKERYR